MITDQDISKLKTVFATKEDLRDFAKKEDLRVFATKKDLNGLATSVAGVEMRMGRLEGRMDGLENRMDAMDEKMDHVMAAVDGIAGKFDTLILENGAGGLVLARHTRQIEALADGTGIKLPD